MNISKFDGNFPISLFFCKSYKKYSLRRTFEFEIFNRTHDFWGSWRRSSQYAIRLTNCVFGVLYWSCTTNERKTMKIERVQKFGKRRDATTDRHGALRWRYCNSQTRAVMLVRKVVYFAQSKYLYRARAASLGSHHSVRLYLGLNYCSRGDFRDTPPLLYWNARFSLDRFKNV